MTSPCTAFLSLAMSSCVSCHFLRLVSLSTPLHCADDDPAHDGQSQETWTGGSSSSELRGSQLITVHAPSKRSPPSNNQHLLSPAGLPHLWTKPWVQRNHSLTTHTHTPLVRLPPKPLRAFQAAGVAAPAMLCCAADVCRVISNSSSRETWFIFTVSECDTGQRNDLCLLVPCEPVPSHQQKR